MLFSIQEEDDADLWDIMLLAGTLLPLLSTTCCGMATFAVRMG
jgi:hypothetical protein